MKNKGLITLLLILSFFALLDFLIIDNFKDKEDSNNRVFVISNIENIKIIKNSNLDLSGDYLVKFNLDENIYDAQKLNDDLILINDNEYAESKFYKDKDYNLYLNLIAKNFDVKIDEYFNVQNDNVITNVSEEGKEVYNSSISNIKEMKSALEGNFKSYDPNDNTKWLRVLDTFDIDTNKVFNKKILKDLSKEVKTIDNYNEKFYLSFFKLEETKEKKVDKTKLNYVGNKKI